MSIKYLLRFEEDYADEFNVYGLKVVSQEYLDELSNLKITEPQEYYFGTNEYVTVNQSTLNNLINNAKVLSQHDLDVLQKHVLPKGSDTFGFFPEFEDSFPEEYWI